MTGISSSANQDSFYPDLLSFRPCSGRRAQTCLNKQNLDLLEGVTPVMVTKPNLHFERLKTCSYQSDHGDYDDANLKRCHIDTLHSLQVVTDGMSIS